MRSKLPASMAVGLRMALERRVGVAANVMRTPIVTATVAIRGPWWARSPSRPACCGSCRNRPATAGEGDGTIEVPGNVRATAPDRIAEDPTVQAATLVNSNSASVGGRRTVLDGLDPLRGSLGFTTLTGRAPAAPDEVVIGPKLADHLGKQVGEPVEVQTASGSPRTNAHRRPRAHDRHERRRLRRRRRP